MTQIAKIVNLFACPEINYYKFARTGSIKVIYERILLDFLMADGHAHFPDKSIDRATPSLIKRFVPGLRLDTFNKASIICFALIY